jgi:hypothetical protein
MLGKLKGVSPTLLKETFAKLSLFGTKENKDTQGQSLAGIDVPEEGDISVITLQHDESDHLLYTGAGK